MLEDTQTILKRVQERAKNPSAFPVSETPNANIAPTSSQAVLSKLFSKQQSPETREANKVIFADKVGEQQSALGKLAEVGDKTFGKAANFLFGTSAKTIGNLIGQGVEAAQGEKGVFTEGFEKQFGSIEKSMMGQDSKGESAVQDIAFTTLELYPGGGFVTKQLRKVPGGTQILGYLSKLPEGLKKKAVEQYASIFNATSKEAKALVKETAPEMLARGEKIMSFDNLAEKAESKVTQYGEKIDDFFNNLPQDAKEQTKPILDKLFELKNKYIVEGKEIRPEAIKAINTTMEKISQFGKEISTESARKMRQIFDEHYDVSRGLDDITVYVKKAERAGADAIRAEFAKTRPELANLNSEFTFWKNVQDLGSYASEKAKGKLTKSIGSIVGGAVGFGQGEGFGGKASGTVIGAFLGTKAIDLMRSPAWKSISAIQKNKLAEAIIRGDANTTNQIITRMITGTQNILTE